MFAFYRRIHAVSASPDPRTSSSSSSTATVAMSSGVGSVLFQPYRSLGLISSHARGHLKLLGPERFLTAALGKGWAVYNLDRLRVVMQGGAREHMIRAIVSVRELTFTAVGNDIIVWRRQEEVHRITQHTAPVYILYLFGSMLISVDESQCMYVWDVKALTPATSVKAQVARALAVTTAASTAADVKPEGEKFISQTGEVMSSDWQPEPLSTLQFPQTSRITSVLHPSTYLNKIVVGFGSSGGGLSSAQTGGLELWNIKTRTMIYRFKTDQWSSEKHNPDAMLDAALGRNSQKRGADGQVIGEALGVTCLEQSPAVDVIAIGLQSGLVLLLNLVSDTVLHAYSHASPGSQTSRGSPIASVSVPHR
jgi:U3 small nucleolar RNA-associated protein 21